MDTQIYTIKNENLSTITFTLKSNALNIFEEPKNNLWTFDLEGRLVGMFIEGINYRRTLDNRFHQKSRELIEGETYRKVEEVEDSKIIPLLDLAHNFIKSHTKDLPDDFNPVLKHILKFNFEVLREDASTFSNIYLPISILPPDQYLSLVIQLTEGCNYNKCTFCNFYKHRPFKIKSVKELHTHINQIKEYFGEGLNLRKSIFLADANAVATPQKRLLESLELIQNSFPKQKEIFSFIDVFTGIKKSVEDFKDLKKLGLKRVYLGIESGNSVLMSFLNKEQLYTDIIELTNTLHLSGIDVGAIFLVGAGGEHFATKHQEDSIKLLKELYLNKGDIVYLSELYESNSNYINSMRQSGFNLPSRSQIREWSNDFKEEVKGIVSKQVQVSIYDINQFFY